LCLTFPLLILLLASPAVREVVWGERFKVKNATIKTTNLLHQQQKF
jgi:hypothetical protein